LVTFFLDMRDLKKERIKTWNFYNKWRQSGSYSPALKANIIISRKGWTHIFYKNKKQRPTKDIMRRFKLVPFAQLLIEKSNTLQDVRLNKKKEFMAIEALVIIEGKLTKLRVVLEVDKQGNIIFYSVMSKGIKVNKKAKCLTLAHILKWR